MPISNKLDRPSNHNTWAWIGGASEGLGAAFARELASAGYNLLLFARREEVLNALSTELKKEFGIKGDPQNENGQEIKLACLDLGDKALAEHLAEWLIHCPPSIAIYNAAFAPIDTLLNSKITDLAQVIAVNTQGPMIWTRAIAEHMASNSNEIAQADSTQSTQLKGEAPVQAPVQAIVLMSSLAALQGSPNIATYAGTKAFNHIFAQGIAHELSTQNVHVYSCCAGAISTPGFNQASHKSAPGTLTPEQVAKYTLRAVYKKQRAAVIVPGLFNKLVYHLMGRILPQRWATQLMANNTNSLGS